MGTIAGINYEQVIGEDGGEVSRDSHSRSRVFKVAWTDVDAFIAAMLGYTEDFGGATVITEAQRYEATSPLFANGASIGTLGKASIGVDGWLDYVGAKITIKYGLPVYDEGAGLGIIGFLGTWAEEDAQFAIVVQPIPGWVIALDGVTGDNKWVKEPVGIPIVTGMLTFTRYNVAAVDRAALIAAMGRPNSATFAGYAAGTLLFGGFAPKRSINTVGLSSAYTVTVAMLYSNIKHGYFFVPAGAGVGRPKIARGLVHNEVPIYGTAAEGALFTSLDFNDL